MLPKDLWKYVIPKYIMISKKEVMKNHWNVMWHIRGRNGCYFCNNTCIYSDCVLCGINVCDDHSDELIGMRGYVDYCQECNFIMDTRGTHCYDDIKLNKTLEVIKCP